MDIQKLNGNTILVLGFRFIFTNNSAKSDILLFILEFRSCQYLASTKISQRYFILEAFR